VIIEARTLWGEKMPDVGWKPSCHFLEKSVVSIIRKGESIATLKEKASVNSKGTTPTSRKVSDFM